MRGKRYLLLIVAGILVLLVNLPMPASRRLKASIKENLVPFQNAVSAFGGKLANFRDFLLNARGAITDRERLAEDIANLQQRLNDVSALEDENRRLRTLLDVSQTSSNRLVLCRVVARDDTSGWWQTVTLNRGSDAGIREDLPVVTTNGLIGRTTLVTKHSTDVLLLTDPGCKVSCRGSSSGTFGIVQGGGIGMLDGANIELLAPVEPCRIDYVDMDSGITNGEMLVTSGLGGVFPAGIPVGSVSRLDMDTSALYLGADVLPAADIARLDDVFVMVPSTVLSDLVDEAAPTEALEP